MTLNKDILSTKFTPMEVYVLRSWAEHATRTDQQPAPVANDELWAKQLLEAAADVLGRDFSDSPEPCWGMLSMLEEYFGS